MLCCQSRSVSQLKYVHWPATVTLACLLDTTHQQLLHQLPSFLFFMSVSMPMSKMLEASRPISPQRTVGTWIRTDCLWNSAQSESEGSPRIPQKGQEPRSVSCSERDKDQILTWLLINLHQKKVTKVCSVYFNEKIERHILIIFVL